MKTPPKFFALVLLLLLLMVTLPFTRARAAGTIYYVKADASGSNDGTSWANAYQSLQSALASVVSGDEIWVAAGTYKPTTHLNRQLSFTLKNSVSIYGGFAGAETQRTQRNWTTNVTTLSGDIGTQNSAADNSFHVVYIGTVSFVRLDGFTIIAGNANGSSTNSYGGGVYIVGGEGIILENLIITTNTAKGQGGGISNGGGAGLVIKNVIFSKNSAADGGGMSNTNASASLTKVTFSNNTASSGGGGMKNSAYNGYSSPTLVSVIFTHNTASEGGGMLNLSYADWQDDVAFANPNLTNVHFNDNSASKTGGGMQNNSYSSSSDFDYWGGLYPILINVNFAGNTAGVAGGGMENHYYANPELNNVTFTGNSAPTGGGMSSKDNSTPKLKNVTFTDNTASITGGWMYNETSKPSLTHVTARGNSSAGDHCGMASKDTRNISVVNSIFWGNGKEVCGSLVGTLKNSIVQGGCPSGFTCTQAMNVNPLFDVLKNNGGFTKTLALGVNSPALDKGVNGGCAASDQRGVARPQGPGCDIGAYEKEQSAVTLSSQGVNDGWIVGIAKDSKDTVVSLGDDDQNRQYRAILSFNTASLSLPAGAVISGARLKLKAQSDLATNLSLAYTLGALIFDIRKGPFGNDVGLELRDFNAAASKEDIGRVSKTPVNALYIETWAKNIVPYINLNGPTQFQLRLAKLTDHDDTSDTMQFFSGDAAAADRPQLIVYYYVP